MLKWVSPPPPVARTLVSPTKLLGDSAEPNSRNGFPPRGLGWNPGPCAVESLSDLLGPAASHPVSPAKEGLQCEQPELWPAGGPGSMAAPPGSLWVELVVFFSQQTPIGGISEAPVDKFSCPMSTQTPV